MCSVSKKMGAQCSPTNYRPISIIRKLFEAIINNKVFEHLEKNKLFTDEQYGFWSARFTTDVLTSIAHRIIEALDVKYTSMKITLKIPKGFGKVWHKGLLHKILSYGITVRFYSIIKSFLKGRSMNVVINEKSSGALAANVSVSRVHYSNQPHFDVHRWSA